MRITPAMAAAIIDARDGSLTRHAAERGRRWRGKLEDHSGRTIEGLIQRRIAVPTAWSADSHRDPVQVAIDTDWLTGTICQNAHVLAYLAWQSAARRQ